MTKTRKVFTLAAAVSLIAVAYQANTPSVDISLASHSAAVSQQASAELGSTTAKLVSENSSAARVDASAITAPTALNTTVWSADVGIRGANELFGPVVNEANDTVAENRSVGIAPRDKMSGPVAAIAAAGGSGMIEIIVRYDQHPELFDDERVAELGGEVTRSYAVLDMRAVSIPAGELENFAGDENIDWLSLDDRVFSTSVSSRIAADVPTGTTSNAAYGGGGIGIAMLDTGVAEHADLTGSFKQYSFLSGPMPKPLIRKIGAVKSYNDTGRGDSFGHGTHVAGILAGSGSDSGEKYEGTSKDASFLSLQVLAGDGSGSLSDVMAGIDWLLDYGSYFDIRVVNLSLGKAVTESNQTDPLVLAVESLWDAGYVVVVAAGNYGHYGNLTITSPANSRKVITVGALTDNGSGENYDDDYVSTFSSLGPTLGDYVVKPDLVAPGNRLIAATSSDSFLAANLPDRLVACTTNKCDSVYLELSGTSMAAPMVSAAAALMLQKDPTLSPATIKARLMRSARKIDSNFVSSGAGLLDVDQAMDEFGIVDGEALSPLMYDDSTNNGFVVEDTSVLWGDPIWGTGFIWTDGDTWTSGFAWTDGDGVRSNGFAWTDGAAVKSNGFGWTDGDGVRTNGFGWTDSGIDAKGFGWTDFVGAQQLLVPDANGLVLYDDPNN